MQALAAGQPHQVEKRLWTALAQLEEHHELLCELERRAAHQDEAAACAARARDVQRLIDQIRELAMGSSLHPDEASDALV